MKIKNIWGLLLLPLTLISCDIPSKLVFNGTKNYHCYTSCGTVNVSGSTLMTDKIIFSLDGDFVVIPDSLKMVITHGKDNMDVCIYHKDILLKPPYNNIHISGRDTICVVVRKTLPVNYGGGEMELLPSSFILCHDIPVIRESIRIRK